MHVFPSGELRRRRRDSNPWTACTVAGFQNRFLRPLGHSSKSVKLFGLLSFLIVRLFALGRFRGTIDPCLAGDGARVPHRYVGAKRDESTQRLAPSLRGYAVRLRPLLVALALALVFSSACAPPQIAYIVSPSGPATTAKAPRLRLRGSSDDSEGRLRGDRHRCIRFAHAHAVPPTMAHPGALLPRLCAIPRGPSPVNTLL
jgi:hypothetical protein